MHGSRKAIPAGATSSILRALRLLTLALAFTALLGTGVIAQGSRLEVRAGLVASSALVEDAVANEPLQQILGDAFQGGVRAVPATSPVVVMALVMPLRPRTALEISTGWTFARLDAEDASGTRELQRLGVGHATAAIRYALHSRLDASCGFGIAHYFADETGLFAAGTEVTPLLECGAGTWFAAATRTIVLRLTGQAQRFRSPALRDAGAQTGTVFRVSLQAGIAFGNPP